MGELAIQVRDLGKLYHRGVQQRPADTLHDAVLQGLARLRGRLPRYARGEGAGSSVAFWALRHVSFEVPCGEVLGIIGANGSGKSTLLKIVSRVTRPTEGWAAIRGRLGSLLEVGTGFHPELTGRENVFLNGAVMGLPRRDVKARFGQILDFSGIGEFIDTPVKHYSSGMYTRLAFAVAAHLDPDILLIDEVLAVGDEAFQHKCQEKMHASARSGKTVLFVSHSMGAVTNMCDRVILLEKGKMASIGAPADEVAQYRGRPAAAKVALPPPASATELRDVAATVLDAAGRERATFRMGEAIHVRLAFEVRQPLPRVVAACGLCTFEGQWVCTQWSASQDLAAGWYEVLFVFDFPLHATTLQIGVGLSSAERSLYQQYGFGQVQIDKVHVDGAARPGSRGNGLLFSDRRPAFQPAVRGVRPVPSTAE